MNLFLAAPDLLSAAKLVLATEGYESGKDLEMEHAKACEVLRAAIAQAEGKADRS